MTNIIFYIISAIIIISALYVVLAKSIFRSALSLATSLMAVALLYFFLNAPFLAAMQILIYVGGIVILILFAVMLTERMANKKMAQINAQVFQSLIAVILIFILFFNILKRIKLSGMTGNFPDISAIAQILFKDYIIQFEVLSVVLLVALIGAIVIAKKD